MKLDTPKNLAGMAVFVIHGLSKEGRMKQQGFFDLPDHLKRLSEAGDPLGEMARAIDFEVFRPALEEALAYLDGSKGGRPYENTIRSVRERLTKAGAIRRLL